MSSRWDVGGDPTATRHLHDAVETLRHNVLVLGSEVTQNHQLLVQLERRVRRAAETTLSFTDHRRAAELAATLRPRQLVGHAKVRVGDPYDGGYVLVDDWIDVVGVISAGAGDNVTFEEDVAGRGIPVHLYDHTVDGLPDGVSEPLIQFFQEPFGATGIGLESALQRMPPTGDLLLKVDTDGCEWDTFGGKADTLLRFRQIVVELHSLHELGDAVWFERAIATLTALTTHHVPVHAHANNVGSYEIIGGRPVPDIIEISLARRDAFDFAADVTGEPGELRKPNDPNRPDYALGFFDLPQ